MRLDQLVAERMGISRSQAALWIADGCVTLDGVVVKKASTKTDGKEMDCTPPPPPSSEVLPEHIPLHILYEDEALIAVNKPPGMITHPATGIYTGTLVNALLGRVTLAGQDEAAAPEGYRPGIVHRLDKDTSGVIVVAKTVAAHAALAAAFKERTTEKTYIAIGLGSWTGEKKVRVDVPIGRHPVQRQKMTVGGSAPREAQTDFTPLSRQGMDGRYATLVKAKPRTGRTHQIRVHMAHLGSPLLGDAVYGRVSGVLARHALHAHRLCVPHPLTGRRLELHAPVPDDLLEAWVALGGTLPPSLLE